MQFLNPASLYILPASVAQLDAPSDWRPGGRQHSFVEIDLEIFSTVILSLPLIQEGQLNLSVSGERTCTILVNRLEDQVCPVNVWLGKLTTLDMTPLGWLGRKTSTQTNHFISLILAPKLAFSRSICTPVFRIAKIPPPTPSPFQKSAYGSGLSAWLAQLVERLTCSHGVASSSSPPKFILLLIIEHVQGSTWKTKLKIPAKNSTGLQIKNCKWIAIFL